jgi:hypothetical protein
MGVNKGSASNLREPQLPSFLQRRAAPATDLHIQQESFQSLLNDLCGELGFDRQQTALRWLLEQLEASHDLRHLILLLLQEGET